MKSKFRIFTSILFCFGSLLTVSLALIIAINFSNSVQIFSKLLGETLVRGVGGLELALRTHLDAAEEQANFIATHILSKDRAISELEGLADFASGSFAAAPQITGVLITDADGRFLGVRRTRWGGVEHEWSETKTDQELALLTEFMSNQTRPSWGPPVYAEALSATVMNYRLPIWRDAEFLGFVLVGISTQELSSLADELSEPPSSRAFVLFGKDRVLSHSYLVLQPGNVSFEKPLLNVNDVLDPVIQRLETASPSPEIVTAEGVDLGLVEVEGTRYGVITKSIEDYGETPLIVGSYFDGSGIRELIRSILRTILVGAGVLAVGLILVFAVSRAISRPVRKTSEVAAGVAALEFDGIEPLQSSRILEIDDLSSSVNAMLVGLESFGRYVPRNLVRKLIRENRVGAGIEERQMTVMFTDIAGFTSTCEGMSPAEVAEFVNNHLTLVSRCIQDTGGTIDKYIGDAVMAFWGAPDRIENPALRAVSAASALQRALARDNEKRASRGLPPVRIRIGVHSGQLIVGDIGSPDRINYTVIGDVVNTAQRLEGLGKTVDGDAESIVLVSRAVKDSVGEQFQMQRIGPMNLKGKSDAIDVYRLIEKS
ncbi:adenylate/guanylate cyclase domain-containing protein [Ovoidimarina sediminis]|uniref:adenylate/guanylate cyclase domain-containing protein n=1 Tax=Ovoidimarina sediminis TaxID=3079856 RepID=UPI002911CDD6|nr:adenylate/guanylate cyclase domain-containing protein [Rhodophyticola sp. MJ-SS7]MDU8945775.1 adenylate/guanylate cyclase domain-containing protein [Rhodophyticola sp. MJ-SS7]